MALLRPRAAALGLGPTAAKSLALLTPRAAAMAAKCGAITNGLLLLRGNILLIWPRVERL